MTTNTTTHDHELPPHPEASFFRGEIALCRTASGSGPYVDAQNARYQHYLLNQFEQYQTAKYARYRELYKILGESAAEKSSLFFECSDCGERTYTTLDAGVRRCAVCASGAGLAIRTPPHSEDGEDDDYDADDEDDEAPGGGGGDDLGFGYYTREQIAEKLALILETTMEPIKVRGIWMTPPKDGILWNINNIISKFDKECGATTEASGFGRYTREQIAEVLEEDYRHPYMLSDINRAIQELEDKPYDEKDWAFPNEDHTPTIVCKQCQTRHLAADSFSGFCTDWCLDEFLSRLMENLHLDD